MIVTVYPPCFPPKSSRSCRGEFRRGRKPASGQAIPAPGPAHAESPSPPNKLSASSRKETRVLVRASQAVGRPLLSPTARRPVLAIIAACAAVLAVLGSLLAGYTGPSPADRPVDDRIFALLGTHPGIVTVTDIGTPLWGGIACLAIAAACAARRRYRAALLPLIAVPAGSILTDHVLKPLINRTARGSLMFPSGHTTVTCAMSVSVVIILAGPARPALPAA